MPNRFDEFIHNENLKNFSKKIEIETDSERLVLLKKLLREEKARRPATGQNRPK